MGKSKLTAPKMCDCISQTEKRILDKVISDEKDKKTKGFKVTESGFQFKSWFPRTELYMPFVIKSTRTKVNGETSRPQNSHVNIFFTYCPFCGKEIKRENQQQKGK